MQANVPNFLVKRPGRTTNFYSRWKKYKSGDVVLCLNEKIDRWEAHPDGVIIEKNGELFINGQNKVFAQERERE